MRSHEHTRSMLRWWREHGVERADLAVKRPSGAMLWHHDLLLSSLPLPWARAQNVRRAEVYVRPARGYSWPVVFLDDVAVDRAKAIANKYDALVVETSPIGGCHVWLACDQILDERSRKRAQRWLARRVAADPGSISGEHLGRLAGFKNWKRGGTWVNVLAASNRGRAWKPNFLIEAPAREVGRRRGTRQTDTTPSGREWGWVCSRLEDGWSPEEIYRRLVEHARWRRGADTERYARRTVQRACDRTGAVAGIGDNNPKDRRYATLTTR